MVKVGNKLTMQRGAFWSVLEEVQERQEEGILIMGRRFLLKIEN